MSSDTTTETTPLSYRQAHDELKQIAQQLEQGETDLDEILPLLERAQKAYGVCQERIDNVRKVLNEWDHQNHQGKSAQTNDE